MSVKITVDSLNQTYTSQENNGYENDTRNKFSFSKIDLNLINHKIYKFNLVLDFQEKFTF